MGDLRYLISEEIPFYITSATLPPAVLLDIIDILRLRPGKTEQILRSNDRPDIHLMVRSLTFPANSFKDLAFLVSNGHQEGDSPVAKKFLITQKRQRQHVVISVRCYHHHIGIK